MKEELLKGLTEEQIAKVKACKNTEEMLAVAKEEGVELTDEQLEAVSGGQCFGITGVTCASCGSSMLDKKDDNGKVIVYYCRNCHYMGNWAK